MVNKVHQAQIQLAGAGFRPRRNGDYQPGEFRRLTNVEVVDGRLRNRRSIHSPFGDASGTIVTASGNAFGFIGTMGTYAIITGENTHRALGPNGVVDMWGVTNLPTPAAASSFHKLIGFFQYNNKNYWLTLKFDAGTDIRIMAYSGNIVDGSDTPSSYGAAYFATLTATTLITIPVANLDYNKFAFRNFFLQGERLWLVTTVGVFYSKATDPLVFASPDGGFFKFPDVNITWGMATRNNVYVLSDNSVHHITYNTDPSLDPVVRRLSDNLGGDSGVIHQDTPYVINNIGIYRIVNGYLDKVLDNDLDFGEDFYINRIKSFGEYLIIQKYRNVNYEKFDSTSTTTRTNLVVNPSVETNSTGWSTASTPYTSRSRDLTKWWAGSVGSMKGTKKTDLTQVRETNLLKNPSFETNVNFWEIATSGDSLTRETTGFSSAPEGNAVARVVNSSGGFPNSLSVGARNDHHMPVVAGTSYTFRLSTRATSIVDGILDETSKLTLNIEWYNSSFDLVDVSSKLYTGITNAFTVKYITATSPFDAAYAKVELTISPNGLLEAIPVGEGIFFDAVSFRATTSTGYFDGDYPDEGTQYQYQWSGTAHNSTSQKMGVDGSNPEISQFDNGATGTLVAASTSYKIGAAFFTTAVRNIRCKVLTYDAASVLLSTSNIDAGTAGDTVANAWKFITYSYNSPANAHHITVIFYVNGTSMAYNEVAYTDGLHVELSSTFTSYFDGSTTDTAAATYAWTGTAHGSTSTATITAGPRRLFKNGPQFTPGEAGNTLGYNVYALNTDNGALHVIDYRDHRSSSAPGYISDVLVNYNKDSSGNYNCFFLTNKFLSEDSSSSSWLANVYYMNTSYEDDFFDYARFGSGELFKYAPKVEIEIESFVPPLLVNMFSDNNLYAFKKFRNLEFYGKVPLQDIKCQFAYDNQAYLAALDLAVGDPLLSRPHFPYRVPLMQRARTLSILIKNEGYDSPLVGDEPYGELELSQMQILWASTARRQDRRALIK